MTPPPQPQAPGERWDLLAGAALAALGLLAYSNALGGAFVFDDVRQIRDYPAVRDLASCLPFRWTGPPGRCVGYLTFAVNYRLGGLAHAGLPPPQRARPRRERAPRVRARPRDLPDPAAPRLRPRAVVARDRLRRGGRCSSRTRSSPRRSPTSSSGSPPSRRRSTSPTVVALRRWRLRDGAPRAARDPDRWAARRWWPPRSSP